MAQFSTLGPSQRDGAFSGTVVVTSPGAWTDLTTGSFNDNVVGGGEKLPDGERFMAIRIRETAGAAAYFLPRAATDEDPDPADNGNIVPANGDMAFTYNLSQGVTTISIYGTARVEVFCL